MDLSKKQLMGTASEHGYRVEIVEKVILLTRLLEYIFKLPLLNKRLALKGGTALNLFYFKQIPRLSIDIDLNYIKTVDKKVLPQEKELVEDALIRICNQLGFRIKRNPRSHAGSKMTLLYDSALNHTGKLELDLNYMYRSPIFGIEERDSHNWPYQVKNIPILDIHEIAAGKLHALFTRTAARDLFDTYYLFSNCKLDKQKLRVAFVVYIAMSKTHWKDFNINKIKFDVIDIKNKLIPVIKKDIIPSQTDKLLALWTKSLLTEVKNKLEESLFPFSYNELKFLNNIYENGIITPELICDDNIIINRIRSHPNLIWRVFTRKTRK